MDAGHPTVTSTSDCAVTNGSRSHARFRGLSSWNDEVLILRRYETDVIYVGGSRDIDDIGDVGEV